jgi:DNA repair photolyase
MSSKQLSLVSTRESQETPSRPSCKSAISPSGLWKKSLGDWVINCYVGCEHGCRHCYCPAMPGVKFFNEHQRQVDWGKYLFPKFGIVDALKNQLERFTPDKAKVTEWGNGWVLMSFLTDPYTQTEAKLKMSRQCLKLILEAGHKVRLQTRSGMVERDFDIITAHPGQVLLGTSLPYLDDVLARTLEPRAPSPSRRIQMLNKARDAGIPTYVAVAPFMPFHGPDTLREVMEVVKPLVTNEIFCEVLNPKGSNLDMMYEVLGKFPDEATRMKAYTPDSWALFTWEILKLGITIDPRFIPWPDTQRFWKKHLNAEQAAFLDIYLPPITE